MEPTLKRLSALVLGAVTLCAAAFMEPSLADETMIRIAILKNADSSVVTTRGRFEIVDLNNRQALNQGRVIRRSRVRATKEGIQVGLDVYPTDKLRIISSKTVTVQIGDEYKRYRGFIDIVANKDRTLTILNTLELEQYVRGVLYHEVTDRWPIEAMKAQAVAVRTYALYQIEKNRESAFDVTSDIYSQVYGGKSAERYRTNIAAQRTQGEVLTYKGEVLPAYFHSNSGGFTEDVRELWKHDLPPLYGREDPHSFEAPNDNWKKNFRSADVQKKLNDAGITIGPIKEINIVERTASGRVKTLEIIDRSGKRATVDGYKFRHIVGPNELKSNLYNIEMQGWFFDVYGKGWGHGVGMSQWGAYNMAKERHDYREILNFYYPGAKITKR